SRARGADRKGIHLGRWCWVRTVNDTYAELMQALPVERLVPGEPARIDQLAQTLLRWSDLFADAARALRRIDVVWTGQAADAFAEEFQLQPAAFTTAAVAMHDAGYAMGSYGIAFHSARDAAVIALETFQRGVRAGLAAQAVGRAAAGGFLPTSGPIDLRDQPVGLQDRLTGIEKLNAAREALLQAGERAAATVRDAMAQAPRQVTSVEHAANFTAGGWTSEKADFWAGGARGLLDLGSAATLPGAGPLVMDPVNAALDGLEWRWNVGSGSGFHQAGAVFVPMVATWGGGGVAAGVEGRAPGLLADTILPKGVNAAPHELFAFGNANQPRPLRIGIDVQIDADGYVHPQAVLWPDGQSTFINPEIAHLRGVYHVIPEGTPMPPGLLVHRDGPEVGGPQAPGHATIFPIDTMTIEQFQALLYGLPWRRAGRIK
ncbi:MAG: putative T7SS-secreted protein, partial [Lapillicoccus sp.]